MQSNILIVGAGDVIVMAVFILIAAVVSVLVYRSIQRPRLALKWQEGGWRARPRDVVLYAVTIPALLVFWWTFLVIILLLSTNSLTSTDILVISGAVVLAVRVLCHLWQEPAHELGKTIPLTLVTLILLSGGYRDSQDLSALADELGRTEITSQAILALVLVDWALTAIWYWLGVRGLWPRGVRIPGVRPAPDPAPVPELEPVPVASDTEGV